MLMLPDMEEFRQPRKRALECAVFLSLPSQDDDMMGRDLVIGMATVTVDSGGRPRAEIELDYQVVTPEPVTEP